MPLLRALTGGDAAVRPPVTLTAAADPEHRIFAAITEPRPNLAVVDVVSNFDPGTESFLGGIWAVALLEIALDSAGSLEVQLDAPMSPQCLRAEPSGRG